MRMIEETHEPIGFHVVAGLSQVVAMGLQGPLEQQVVNREGGLPEKGGWWALEVLAGGNVRAVPEDSKAGRRLLPKKTRPSTS